MKKLAKKIAALFFAVSLTVLFAMPAFAATFPNSYYSTSSANRTALKIKVSNTSEYLNVYSSTIGDQKAISTWSKDNSTTQKFVVYKGGDGVVTVRMYDDLLLAISSSAGNCVLRYIPNVGLNNIQISSIHSENYNGPFYAWTFDVSSGGSLTATNSATPISGGYMVAWQNFTGSNRQIWNVDPW